MEGLTLIILLVMPGVWSANWGVTFESQCALKGTTVVIKCEYEYGIGHRVTSVGWSKAQYVSDKWRLFPLSDLSPPPDHFRYVGNYWSDCSLQIKDVRHTDEGPYYFSFVTTFSQWTSRTGAYLSVKELTAVVQPRTVTEGDNVSLTCVPGCPTPVDTVWFRDGHPVLNPVFQARREDVGRYYCAILGQDTVRSASVALNVQYVPEKVTLSMSPSGDVVRGSSVTFTCSSDASPSVTQSGYSLYEDGQFIRSGQNHTISDIQPSHSGLYYCQAWNNISRRGIDFINSTEIHLNVQYRPINISISMNPPHVVGGSSVNLTCSTAANPAADNYTWYRRTASTSPMQRVGSGQLLSIPSVEASHTGHYVCQASNLLGENFSTELLLSMKEEEYGSQSLPVIAGIGVSLFVTLVLALLFWRNRRKHAENKQTVFDLRLSVKHSTDTENESNSNYVNIHPLPCSPPPVTDITLQSQTSSHCEHDATTSYEDEVTYSTVTMKPRNTSPPHHTDNSRALQDSQSEVGQNDDSVIYATVAKPS